MTGRSTGAEDYKSMQMPLGRHSIALENLTSQMDKQTSEIQDIMRHSIASNYSFHSKVLLHIVNLLSYRKYSIRLVFGKLNTTYQEIFGYYFLL